MADADQRPLATLHDMRGKFAIGNPGRKLGSKNKISKAALDAVKDMKDSAILQLREKLAAGDWQAILFVLDRVLPKGRTIEMDGVEPADVVEMMQSGELTTSEAKDIAVAIAKLREIDEIALIRAKLDDLEKLIGDGARK